MACYRFLLSNLTLIVDFDGYDSGTSIVDEITPSRLGKHYSKYWAPHDRRDVWEPCEDPRPSQRVNKMLKHIKGI